MLYVQLAGAEGKRCVEKDRKSFRELQAAHSLGWSRRKERDFLFHCSKNFLSQKIVEYAILTQRSRGLSRKSYSVLLNRECYKLN